MIRTRWGRTALKRGDCPSEPQMEFIMQQLPGGDIVLKRAVVVPMNEKRLDPAVHAELEAARQWRQNNPAKATDLTGTGF
jgi:hypothetical protein